MITPDKLRELASYSIGSDLQGRIDIAAKFQNDQRDALLEAASDIESLVSRISSLEQKKACSGFSCPYNHGSTAVVKDTDTSL